MILISRVVGGPGPVHDLHTSAQTSQTVNVSFIPGFNGGLNQSFSIQYKLAAEPDEDQYYVLYADGE